MTSYEIVKRVIEFTAPERIPSSSPAFGRLDFHYISLETPVYTPRKPGYREWGYGMRETEVPNHGMPVDPPIATWDMLADYRWPEAANEERYRSIGPRLDRPEAEGKYIHMGWFVGLFDMVYRLHGFENCMIDFLAERENMKCIIAKVARFILGAIDELARRFPGKIHGLLIPDDWGGQDSTFISVSMWEEFFGGHYRKIARHLHDAGMHFWLHSDGRINDLIETLIDCGVDVLNLPAPRVVGIDEISRRFAGRICFANGVDIQSTGVRGTDSEIEQEVRELLSGWNTPRGGFIPSDMGNLQMIGSTLHRRLVAVNAFRKHAWGLPPLTEEELTAQA